MKVAIYTRVSTTDQGTTTQEKLCKEYCQRLGYEIYGIYSDSGVSGAYIDKSGSYTIRRPSFEAMLKDMRSFKFNMILCTKLDWIGRSLKGGH